jgi:predicted O-methyltransferase YrrM
MEGPMVDWDELLGTDIDDYCDNLSRTKPDWVEGSISFQDARFVFRKILELTPRSVVEIGTASGFSTVILVHALAAVAKAGLIADDFKVVSYDISPYLYFDHARLPGDAARELLPDGVLEHVSFRYPATAIELRQEFEPDSIEFLFLDGAHDHPWPALDLLAILDRLMPTGIVVLHDINLPRIEPESARWGVKYAYDAFTERELDKQYAVADIPNSGSFFVPGEREWMRDRLLSVLYDYPWELEVAPEYTTELLA